MVVTLHQRMKRNFGTIFNICTEFLIISFLLILSFNSFSQGNNHIITKSDSVINGKIDEEFELRLHNNMDGYIWYLGGYDTSGIRFKGKSDESIKNEFSKGTTTIFFVGGGFIEIWKFVGLKKGRYNLNFDYKNQEQTITKENKTFIIRIE